MKLDVNMNRMIDFERRDGKQYPKPEYWDDAIDALDKLIEHTDDLNAVERLLCAYLGGVIKGWTKSASLKRKEIELTEWLCKNEPWVDSLFNSDGWWLDHSKIYQYAKDGRILVECEPYFTTRSINEIEKLNKFCNENGIAYSLYAQSQHFPARTISIIFIKNRQK